MLINQLFKEVLVNQLPPVITIDGPSSVGKSSLSRILAKKFKWSLLNSGILYRIIAFLSEKFNVNINNEDDLLLLANFFNISFYFKHTTVIVFFKKKNITCNLYTEKIANIASKIAIFPRLRKILLYKQRNFRVKPGLIAEGRDMGTVVFPDARIKFFLFCNLQVRIYRRFKELKNMGLNVNIDEVRAHVIKRDRRDKIRKYSPLLIPKNAYVIDVTKLSIEDLQLIVLNYCKEKNIFIDKI
ncbi:MAG: (d)CMP kinase [Arsenophonus sp.]|nr:MAG: (d)CMP kinase [Arsenophonus sp.]